MSGGPSPAGEHHRQRCRHCDDVIGVYEPMILVSPEARCETSVLAEPNLPPNAECYHRDCYVSRPAPDSG